MPDPQEADLEDDDLEDEDTPEPETEPEPKKRKEPTAKDRVKKNPDGTVTIRLYDQLEDPEPTDPGKLKLRRCYCRDMLAMDQTPKEHGNTRFAVMLCRLSGESMDTIRRLSADDYDWAAVGCAIQMGKSPLTSIN